MYFSIEKFPLKGVTAPIIFGAASFGIGFYIGSRYFSKKNILDDVQENEQMSLFEYYESEEIQEPEEIQYSEEAEEILNQPVILNVFDGYKNNWDWDIEMMHREDNTIYVIHYEEFVNNESNYSQETLTYYAGDDILTDQMNTPIYDYQKMTGKLDFGHGSKDPNIVFIRNDEIHMEWEILREEGKYQIEVLGYDIEEDYERSDLKHSNSYKFREE